MPSPRARKQRQKEKHLSLGLGPYIAELREDGSGRSWAQIAKILGCSRGALVRYRKRHNVDALQEQVLERRRKRLAAKALKALDAHLERYLEGSGERLDSRIALATAGMDARKPDERSVKDEVAQELRDATAQALKSRQ